MIKTYSSFTGADFVLICNEKVYGEFVACRSNSIDKTIELDMSFFNSLPDTDKELREIENGKLTEAFANEFNCKMCKSYLGLKYKGQKSNRSVDDTILVNTYIFSYESDTPFAVLDKLITDMIKR